jgi:MFS family permease
VTDQAASAASTAAAAVSRALAEPTELVRARWVTTLSFASLGMWMCSLTPLQVLIPIQLQDITPGHKIAALSVVSAAGAITAGLATPIAGALSDRTTRPLPRGWLSGRRHRWTLSMAVGSALALIILGHAGSVLAVALLWALFNVFQNAEYASLSAAIPDHVPVRQRATVAGWVGMPQALGLVLGTLLVVDVFTHTVAGYNALAVALVILTLPFMRSPDHVLDPADRQPFSWAELARSYWISPRQYPDFAWAWLTRFLMSLAIAMGTLYLLYFLRDAVHYRHPSQGLLILILIYTTGVVLTAIVGGMISDRSGRRRRLVVVSGCTIAAAALLLTFVETWTAALLAAVLFGIGFGAYLAVDQALITQVLPEAADRAKDLGIINIAIVVPGALGAAVSAPLVSLGGYPSLYAGTAVVALAGSVFVWKIKSVP